LRFTTEFPLKEGANSVVVVARQTQDFASRKVLILRRRPAAVAQALARGTTTESAARPAPFPAER
jgi:carboxyl-terminal processing protease